MTARVRIAVAVAIFFALAAHPLVHPLVKECPCVHAPAAPEAVRQESLILTLRGERLSVAAGPALPAPAMTVRASRAPPAA